MNTRSGLGRVARDLIDLCELQMQLLSVDSQEAKRKAVRAIAFALVGATLAGSALTTGMVGCGYLIHDAAGWGVGISLLTVAAATFALVTGLFIAAMFAIQSASKAMNETKSEFAENLKWIKAVLISPEKSPRNQMRAENFHAAAQGAKPATSRYPTSPLFNGR